MLSTSIIEIFPCAFKAILRALLCIIDCGSVRLFHRNLCRIRFSLEQVACFHRYLVADVSLILMLTYFSSYAIVDSITNYSALLLSWSAVTQQQKWQRQNILQKEIILNSEIFKKNVIRNKALL